MINNQKTIKQSKYALVFCLVFSHGVALASTCENLTTVSNVIDCALLNHPEILENKMGEESASSLQNIAELRPNPEFNSRMLWSSPDSGSVLNSEVNLAHTFEIGNRRGARIEKAMAQINLAKLETKNAKEKVYFGTVISLLRLRQIDAEISSLKDALNSFTRMQNQYKGRVKLNPEQQTSLRLFEIAEIDYRSRLLALENDFKENLKLVRYAVGSDFVPTNQSLPKKQLSWPIIGDDEARSLENNSEIKLAEINLKLSQADLALAKSESFSEIKVGPSFEFQKSRGDNIAAYGFNISFPLPVYHQNGAAKTFSNLEIKRREYISNSKNAEVLKERQYLLEKYRSEIKLLNQFKSTSDVVKKHKEVEDLFSRGLIPGNLLIEVHRQVHDFTTSFNIQEISAAESLIKIYLLNGRFPEERIW